MDAIAAAGITDNVIDLMTRKIRRLSPAAQHALTMAACIGNQFDWNTFLIISRQSLEHAAAALAEAVHAGLIQETTDASKATDERASARTVYSFLHDRPTGRLRADSGRPEETGSPRRRSLAARRF